MGLVTHGRADGRATSGWASRTASTSGRAGWRESNAEQVAKIRRILEELTLDIATPDETRAMLDLKGRANTGFV